MLDAELALEVLCLIAHSELKVCFCGDMLEVLAWLSCFWAVDTERSWTSGGAPDNGTFGMLVSETSAVK